MSEQNQPENDPTIQNLVRLLASNKNTPLAVYETTPDVFLPWMLVSRSDGEKMAQQYAAEAPQRALDRLAKTDPTRHAEMSRLCTEAKQADKLNWERIRAGETSLYEENPALRQTRLAYYEFVQEAQNAFRPADFPRDRDMFGDSVLRGQNYALFVNVETGAYLATMREHTPGKEELVDYKVLDVRPGLATADTPGGTPAEQALAVAMETAWIPWLERTLRFAPFTERAQIQSMDEAQRLRDKFAAAADDTPSRPRKALFEFFPAFRRAYGGEDGFFRALDDVFGKDGNTAYLASAGTRRSDWGGYAEGGNLAAKYEVGGHEFVALYKEMGDADRADFKKALNRFLDTSLPGIIEGLEDRQKARTIAVGTAAALTRIKEAVDNGPGALLSANYCAETMEAWMHDRSAMIRKMLPDELGPPSKKEYKGPVW